MLDLYEFGSSNWSNWSSSILGFCKRHYNISRNATEVSLQKQVLYESSTVCDDEGNNSVSGKHNTEGSKGAI